VWCWRSTGEAGWFGSSERLPSRLRIESLVGEPVISALRAMGHDVDIAAPWSEGFLLGIERHSGTGIL
jgi:hypothetical protein